MPNSISCVPTGKEARKKELKKNKRQRMAVRAAVLKGKDPTQLIVEMEKMDQMGKYSTYTHFESYWLSRYYIL